MISLEKTTMTITKITVPYIHQNNMPDIPLKNENLRSSMLEKLHTQPMEVNRNHQDGECEWNQKAVVPVMQWKQRDPYELKVGKPQVVDVGH